MKRQCIITLLSLGGAFIIASCKDDEYVYPSVVTEFIDARTDNTGTLTQLISDNGEIMNVQERNGLSGLTPDTVYRTVSIYEPMEDNEVYLYSSQSVLSMIPVAEDYFKEDIKTDPTDIRSIWQSGNYLNMILTPLIKDQSHAFHFIDYDITEQNGQNILYLKLYHDRNNDEEAFTHEVYLSVPLWYYQDKMNTTDSVFFEINTYDGANVYKFLFPEIKSYQ